MSDEPCMHCGRSEDDHHSFEAIQGRPGCVCETMSWGSPNNIPPVCAAFVPMRVPEETYCQSCEHDKGCHSEAAQKRTP